MRIRFRWFRVPAIWLIRFRFSLWRGGNMRWMPGGSADVFAIYSFQNPDHGHDRRFIKAVIHRPDNK
ncbi:MAG: hypothetical protein DRP64_09765 [Verrucomicrobia bacterium]|nr:MAG: hypothetical protein DRP64_09765 [Verrucomicrobiota bacterium]